MKAKGTIHGKEEVITLPSKRSQPSETPPDLPPQKAHSVLAAQLEKLQAFKTQGYQQAEAAENEWFQLTAKLVMRSFGSGSPNYSEVLPKIRTTQ
ncbi:MAG: hypothetical protein WCA38_10380 [Candidatus Acidiferrales bacterium]